MYSFHDYLSSHDRFGTIGSHEQKIEKLARKLKTSVEDVIKAVQEVGFEPEEVQEYIRDRYNRG